MILDQRGNPIDPPPLPNRFGHFVVPADAHIKTPAPVRRVLADPGTAVRACPDCGGDMRVPPGSEVKTTWPPRYLFRCACGAEIWGPHPQDGFL